MGAQAGGFHNSDQLDTITYDGVINENMFSIEKRETEEINNLEIANAKVKSPLTGTTENFLGLFIKSKYDGTEGIREPIDICILLDISGSMSLTISYSQNENGEQKTRNILSKRAINKLITRLKEDDGLAINTFNTTSNSIINLKLRKEITDKDLDSINAIEPDGGTLITQALKGGMDQLEKSTKKNKRIILITDLWGASNEKDSFVKLFKQCVNEKHIEITIIGISQKANSEWAEIVAYEKGCSYYSVEKDEDLEKYLVTDFNYFCFPHSYDVEVKFGSGNSRIVECIGVGDKQIENEKFLVDQENTKAEFLQCKKEMRTLLMCLKKVGKKLPNTCCCSIGNYLRYNKLDICKIGTVMPSELQIKDRKVYMEGGLILLKLSQNGMLQIQNEDEFNCEFDLIYKGRDSTKYKKHFNFSKKLKDDLGKSDDYFSNESVEKGVALYYFTKYCKELMKFKNTLEKQKQNETKDLKNPVNKEKKNLNQDKNFKYNGKLESIKNYLQKHYKKEEGIPNHLEKYFKKLEDNLI